MGHDPKFDEWVLKLDEGCEAYLNRRDLNTTSEKNVRIMDLLFQRLFRRCANPFCGWPIQVYRDQTYAAPFYGEVCATCHDLYTALSITNTQLSSPKWFHNAHDAWVEEETRRKQEYKRKRRDMGLDDGVS
jgi:hypothetical protein